MRLLRALIDRFREVAATKFTLYAGNAAFFTVLAIFPAAVFLLALLQLTPLTRDALHQLLSPVIPAQLQEVVSALTKTASASSAILSVSAIAAAWSASKGVLAILNGVNAIYDVPRGRNYLYKRFQSLLYMVLLVVSIVLTLTLHAFGRTLLQFISEHAPGLYTMMSVLLRLKFIIVIAFLSLIFTAIYYFFPNCKTTLRCSLPGAVTAAAGWVGFSELFSIYVEHNRLSALYGSLTMLILLMLWIYFSMSILMFGAVVNHHLRTGAIHKFLYSIRHPKED